MIVTEISIRIVRAVLESCLPILGARPRGGKEGRPRGGKEGCGRPVISLLLVVNE